MGKSLHAPLYDLGQRNFESDYEEKITERVPDVVSVHPAPSDRESLGRYLLTEDHLTFLDEVNPRWDPLVVVSDGMQNLISSEVSNNFMDQGFEVQDFDRAPETTIDDLEALEEITSDSDRIDTVTSDYHRKRCNRHAEYILGESLYDILGVETDDMGRDSAFMRGVELAKTEAQHWPHRLFGLNLD